MNSSQIKQKIEIKAREIGFDKFGVSLPEKLDSNFLDNWLEKGYHSGMGWMERRSDERLDPNKYYPKTKSIISVALNYYNEPEKSASDEDRDGNKGKVSIYAVGKDYHFIIPDMLKELLAYIKELIPEAEGICVVDTSPVPDKIWAAKSGLGWIGKHSNVITKDFGSYVFLGEILLSYELQPDNPMNNFCGTCTECIDKCPTNAIVEPYVVDSNKCISYRTIEHKGDFPEEWDGDNSDWIFGCDVCQEVCPWNKFVKLTNVQDFLAIDGINEVDLSYFDNMDDQEFREKFKKSPLKRTKLAGMQRNANNVKNYFKENID